MRPTTARLVIEPVATRRTGAARDLLGAVLVLLALALPGCFDPVVGYPCATGFSVCEGTCVDLSRSALHCGGCNIQCAGPCRSGICIVRSDAGDPVIPEVPGNGNPDTNPGMPDAGPDAGGDARADGGDARLDGGHALADGGALDGGDASVDLNNDTPVANDGAQPGDGAPPGGDGSVVGPGDGPVVPGDAAPVVDAPPGADVPPVVCTAGFTACDNRCVLLATDPDNCGACNNPCGSGLCAAGICLQQGVGHLVVIGHDYVVNRSGMNNLLGNSVFLSASDPVAVLAYEGHASVGAIAGTNFAIDQVATERGRQWNRTVGSAISVATNLQNYDVLLVYAQAASVDQTLTDDAIAWDAAMTTFLAQGKTIVVLDGPSTTNAGTFQVVSAAGLLSVTARTEVTGQTLILSNLADAVSPRVPRTYRAEMTSVSFTTTEPNKVVTTMGGAAVVIHRTF